MRQPVDETDRVRDEQLAPNLGEVLAALAAGGPPLRTIVVTTLRDPVAKSYRKMVDGVELFERRRHLAPAATLRFKLLPRKHDTPMEGIALQVAGGCVVLLGIYLARRGST